MATQYSPKIVTNGLVLCLDAGNTKSYPGTGTAWTNLSDSNNTGTLTNGPTFNSANGGSLVFDGVNDYVVNAATPVFNFATTNAMTAEAWINYSPSSYDFWFTANASGDICTYRFGTDSSGYFYWDMGSHADRNYSSYVLASNLWKHVVFTGGIESGYITTRIYVNGMLITYNTETVTTLPNPADYYVGTGEGPGVHPFNGKIALVRVYNTVLTPTQILQNYNATKGRFGL